jgi:predicted PurR-regulated permease PerM
MAPPRHVERLRLTPRSAALAVGLLGTAIALLRLLASAERVLGWIFAAAALAGLVHPIVARLARWMPRGAALLLVVVLGLGTVSAVAIPIVQGVAHEWHKLEKIAPQRAAQLEERGRFSQAARDFHLARRMRRFVRHVPEQLRGGTPAEAVRAATTRGVAFLITGVLALFLELHGPGIAAAAARQISDRTRRERLSRVATNAFRRAFGYARWSGLIAVLAGMVAFGIARTAHVPGPAPLALWVGMWDVVPIVGASIGALPIVVLASITSPARGAVVALAFGTYQIVENRVLQHRAEEATIRVGPFLTVIAGLGGLELRGLGGALIAILAVTIAAAAADELAPPLPAE